LLINQSCISLHFKSKIGTDDHPLVRAMLEVVDIAAWGRDFAAPQLMLATVGVRNVIPHRQRPSALVLRRSRPSLLNQSCTCLHAPLGA
jgi:hypothetical protein